MKRFVLSEEVKRFVEENIVSIDHLETLLLLHRESGRNWNAHEVMNSLRNSYEAAEVTLALLRSLGLCVVEKREDGGSAYRFSPKSDELRAAVDSLATVYSSYRITIVDLIYSRTKTKIISLSEAFRIKKDEDGHG